MSAAPATRKSSWRVDNLASVQRKSQRRAITNAAVIAKTTRIGRIARDTKAPVARAAPRIRVTQLLHNLSDGHADSTRQVRRPELQGEIRWGRKVGGHQPEFVTVEQQRRKRGHADGRNCGNNNWPFSQDDDQRDERIKLHKPREDDQAIAAKAKRQRQNAEMNARYNHQKQDKIGVAAFRDQERGGGQRREQAMKRSRQLCAGGSVARDRKNSTQTVSIVTLIQSSPAARKVARSNKGE